MNIKSKWNKFASTSIVIFSIAVTFIIQPPQLQLEEDSRINWLTKFLIAGLIAILTIPILKKSTRSYYKFWHRWAIAGLVFAIVFVGLYTYLRNTWSVPYYFNTRLVIGKTMTKEAQEQKLQLASKLNLPFVNNEKLVKARNGETNYIWPQKELEARYFSLSFLYILSFLLVSVFIISVIQSIYCYEKKDN